MDKLRKVWGQKDTSKRDKVKFSRFTNRTSSSKKGAALVGKVPTIFVTTPSNNQLIRPIPGQDTNQLDHDKNVQVSSNEVSTPPEYGINIPTAESNSPVLNYNKVSQVDQKKCSPDSKNSQVSNQLHNEKSNSATGRNGKETCSTPTNDRFNQNTDQTGDIIESNVHVDSKHHKGTKLPNLADIENNSTINLRKGNEFIQVTIESSFENQSLPQTDNSNYTKTDYDHNALESNLPGIENNRYSKPEDDSITSNSFKDKTVEIDSNRYATNGEDINSFEEASLELRNRQLAPSSVEEVGGLSHATVVAPDGGWGWLVLAGCVYNGMLLTSLSSCFGVLFRDVMVDMGVSSINVAWILNVHVFLWNLVAILAAPICKHVDWRIVGCTGAFVVSLAFIAMSQLVTPIFIFFMFSIVIGMAGGITTVMCFVILPLYFNKRRGMASSFFLAGAALGQIVIPLTIRNLQDEFGFAGATLIHGGILLNCCVAAALFRPLNKTRKEYLKKNSSSRSNGIAESNNENTINLLEATNPSHNTQLRSKTRNNSCFRTAYKVCSDIASTTIKNMKELKNPRMILVTLSLSFIVIGYINFISMVPFALMSQNYTAQDASLSVSLSGVGNVLTRIIISFIIDKNWFNKRAAYISGCLLTSGCAFMFPLLINNLHLLWANMVGWGVGVGLANSVYVVLLIDVVGMQGYEAGVSITCLMLAFISLVAGPAIGLVADATSYLVSIYACAALKLCSVIVWMFIPCTSTRHAQNTATT
uniref:Monocarboxylate transporter 6-like n=1 Tax=Hirondellea gigas TaxID=1518452 RepID=A0A2P2I2K3_9CRUS